MQYSATRIGVLVGLLVGLLLPPLPAGAQDQGEASEDAEQFFPRHGSLLTGYGAAGYSTVFEEESQPNDFSALIAPVMLFQISDRFLFESELEFELEEGVTRARLEYAQVDLSLTNNLTLVGGKFLLPFLAFTERYHPTWINPFVSMPPVYGGHHGGTGPTQALLPVLSDVGAQLRGSFPIGRFGFLTASVFVSQGPRTERGHAEEEGHGDGEEDHHGSGAASVPLNGEDGHHGTDSPRSIVHGTTFTDNNQDKMIGGRVGFGLAPYFEVDLSGMTGAYDAAGDRRFSALGAHLEGRYESLTLHSELMWTLQEVRHEAEREGDDTLARTGYWLQASYRQGKWEPLVRWSQVFDGGLGDETLFPGGRQLAVGLDYWIEPSLFVKAEYLVNFEDGSEVKNNRLALQLAFGF